ncbi:OX-2 membrane glycoprotein-like [Cheilinus undulatus]|uniref:OX-2 membrane glycoprotein-like n=1 Tax=Cheilinus undulatus TaxID=241271 RepID=UPI001BD554BD|nr:OX-2 membrane glycoprotein-like [Cheilinus undulatus]
MQYLKSGKPIKTYLIALTALIQTQQTVMAAVGEQACLKCQLVKYKDVLQVTWQKVLPDGERNVATYNRYGERVNPGFQGKVEFKDAGLQDSSIVIKEVTEQDEGCYRCLFNTYPDGALICSTCIKLYELHGPFLHVKESNSSDEVIVSCSATARPAPTVTLNVHNHNSSTHSDHNTNGTVTVTTTAVLQRYYDNSTQVECAVQVPSVPPKLVFGTIFEAKQPSTDGFRAESESDSMVYMRIVVASIIVGVVCVALVSLWWRVHKWSRYCCVSILKLKSEQPHVDPEEIKTPLKSQDYHSTTTPLFQQQNKQTGTRQHMSTVKKEKYDSPKASSPKDGWLIHDEAHPVFFWHKSCLIFLGCFCFY